MSSLDFTLFTAFLFVCTYSNCCTCHEALKLLFSSVFSVFTHFLQIFQSICRVLLTREWSRKSNHQKARPPLKSWHPQMKVRREEQRTLTGEIFFHFTFFSVLISEYEGWRSRPLNSQVLGLNASTAGKTALSRSVQPVNGRVDWTAKYSGHR